MERMGAVAVYISILFLLSLIFLPFLASLPRKDRASAGVLYYCNEWI